MRSMRWRDRATHSISQLGISDRGSQNLVRGTKLLGIYLVDELGVELVDYLDHRPCVGVPEVAQRHVELSRVVRITVGGGESSALESVGDLSRGLPRDAKRCSELTDRERVVSEVPYGRCVASPVVRVAKNFEAARHFVEPTLRRPREQVAEAIGRTRLVHHDPSMASLRNEVAYIWSRGLADTDTAPEAFTAESSSVPSLPGDSMPRSR